MMIQDIIRKWYQRLEFPEQFDREFERYVNTIPLSPDISIDTYDLHCPDGRRNLLSFLYMCEAAEGEYRRLGIGEEILLDTLRDIVRWTETWSGIKGELCLFELEWLARILRSRLFKVGRLQFYLAPAREDIPSYGIRRGDQVVEIHIPPGGKLSPEAVEESMARGEQFLQTYFPDYEYRYYTCHSWLLDGKLREYLPENSNILRFADRFDRVQAVESDLLIRFLFRWDTCKENLAQQVCCTSFQRAIRDAVLRDETFHVTTGVIRKWQ